jgi:Carbohydrate binding module (family 6)
MKRKLQSPALAAILLASITAATLHAQQLAFPGAQGFGAYATGGRTGTVYHVTTLADSGTGSFRDAVSSGNRIVVFDVGGYISLATAVSVNSNITIAGQTAPGGGIGFKGGEISFGSKSNIICRHIRIRPGSDTASTTDDALSLYNAHNIICDHLSLEFAPWNNIGAVSDDWQNKPVTAVTFQNCIVADPTYQQFGAHTESVSSNMAWYNNVFANSHNRNPLSKINDVFVNNVLYNCDAGYTTHTSTNFSHDIVNNYFIAGPASTSNFPWYQVDLNQSIYYSGNLYDSNKNGTLDGATTTPYWYQGPGTILTSPWSTWTSGVTITSPASAVRRSISLAGALPRDEMDALIMNQVKTLGSGTSGTGAGTTGPTGSLYTTQTQTGLGNNGYGTISGGTVSLDTDGDAMPDYWERALGSNVTTADSMVVASNGYTRLENYINWLADPHVAGSGSSNIDILLTAYTGGFTASPVFTVTGAVNGSVSLLSDGKTARFVPTAGFSGLGSYKFTVTDSAGSTMTTTVGVLVPAGVTTTLQAEAGTIGGGTTIDSNNAGFNGTGFANFSLTGGYLQFSNVNGGTGGAGTVTIRYALGATTARTGQIVINGVTYSLTNNPTGAWTTWVNQVVPVTLASGTTNTIRFQSNAQDLGNIDEITVAKP